MVHLDGDLAIHLVCRSCGRWGASLTQSNWLQWLPPREVICERPTDLSQESPLVLWVAKAARGELGRAETEVGAGELRVLPHRLAALTSRRGRYGRLQRVPRRTLASQSPIDCDRGRRASTGSARPHPFPVAAR